jgi:hypothetical protein
MKSILILAQKVNLHPDPGKLPGSEQLQSLTDGIGGFALISCLIGLVIGAALWALGSNSNNYQQTVIGKKACLVCWLGAMLIGAAPAIINFFYAMGHRV